MLVKKPPTGKYNIGNALKCNENLTQRVYNSITKLIFTNLFIYRKSYFGKEAIWTYVNYLIDEALANGDCCNDYSMESEDDII